MSSTTEIGDIRNVSKQRDKRETMLPIRCYPALFELENC